MINHIYKFQDNLSSSHQPSYQASVRTSSARFVQKKLFFVQPTLVIQGKIILILHSIVEQKEIHFVQFFNLLNLF